LHRTGHDLSKAVFPTDVLVKKHRHGPVGKCSLLFVSHRVRFEMPEVRHEPSSKGRDWGG
jgi:replicative DNA helicase